MLSKGITLLSGVLGVSPKISGSNLLSASELAVQVPCLFLNIGKGDLPQGGKERKRSYEKIRRANNNLAGTSISERAEEIESRKDFGHWELDTVVGKAKTKAALLVLTERKTRYALRVDDSISERVLRMCGKW